MSNFLIDADSIVFRAGCSIEDRYYIILDADGSMVGRNNIKKEADKLVPVGGSIIRHKEFKDGIDTEEALIIAKGRLNDVIGNCLNHPDCSSYQVFIGGEGNFRKDLYPEYKGHRDDFARPMLEEELREYLCTKYKAIKCDGEEAEDAVSYRALRQEDCVIAHIDKDLNNTAGKHYNYVTQEEYILSPKEADVNFYRQVLTGDATDNIPGIKGCGPVKAAVIIPEYTTPSAMWGKVEAAYHEAGLSTEFAILMARLVYIRRQENELWVPPQEVQQELFAA